MHVRTQVRTTYTAAYLIVGTKEGLEKIKGGLEEDSWKTLGVLG